MSKNGINWHSTFERMFNCKTAVWLARLAWVRQVLNQLTNLPTRRGSGSERWSLAALCSPLDPRKGCERRGSAWCHRPHPRSLCYSGSGTLKASAHSDQTDKGPTRRVSEHRTYLRRWRDVKKFKVWCKKFMWYVLWWEISFLAKFIKFLLYLKLFLICTEISL